MFKRTEPKKVDSPSLVFHFPHCDQRVLHAPKECAFCDLHPEWQALRAYWGIAFTGYTPEGNELPCPADYARGDNHTKWSGNKAKPAEPGNWVCMNPSCAIVRRHIHNYFTGVVEWTE